MNQDRTGALSWVPSLYFTEGLPYVMVMSVSVILYKKLGISNTDIALYTSWLYLPWVIKPLWSPLVDTIKSKRFWILATQLLIGAGLAGLALTIPTNSFFQYSLAFFWLLAFSSATHDIAADGFYMLGLSDHQQAMYVGVRSMFYRIAMITGQGLLVLLAGYFESTFAADGTPNIPSAWSNTFLILSGLFLLLFCYHSFVLPRPQGDLSAQKRDIRELISVFAETFASFFQRKGIVAIVAFILLYRFSEAQLSKLAAPFLLDNGNLGGLALSTQEVGIVYGTVGILMLTLGGLLGGFLVARQGLKYWLFWMVLAINLPNIVYVFLSQVLPDNLIVISVAVGIEQFGYGLGFTAYMMYLIYVSRGTHQTAHFAIGTGLMALGMMIPGMFSGWLQELLGYANFFVWVLVATIPSFIVARMIVVDAQFGRSEE